MAQRLRPLARAAVLALAVSPSVGGAFAQAGLKDPMRPPNVVPGLAAEEGARPQSARFQLQSVLISPHRKLAVIDGRTVLLGGKLDEATLVGISETQVTLKQGEQFSTLELYPGIERKPVQQEGGADKRKGTNR